MDRPTEEKDRGKVVLGGKERGEDRDAFGSLGMEGGQTLQKDKF